MHRSRFVVGTCIWPAYPGRVQGFACRRNIVTIDLLDGSVYRRCGCRDRTTGRQLGSGCPRWTDPAHGRWYFAVQISTPTGRRVRVRRGGYGSLAAAEQARQNLPALSAAAAAGRAWTIGRWLGPGLPAIQGRVRLASLRAAQVQAAFRIIASGRTRSGRLIASSTLERIRATLRSALSEAIRQGLIDTNPALKVRLSKPSRVRPVVWTTTREIA